MPRPPTRTCSAEPTDRVLHPAGPSRLPPLTGGAGSVAHVAMPDAIAPFLSDVPQAELDGLLDFQEVVGPLTDPTAYGGDSRDAFHVVCPLLPGYGFSDRPARSGWGIERIARAWITLMDRLGYARYGAQGIHLTPALGAAPLHGHPVVGRASAGRAVRRRGAARAVRRRAARVLPARRLNGWHPVTRSTRARR